MRSIFGSIVFLSAMLAIGCTTVSPNDCWPNTSGGLGGSSTIPIGAGVGTTTGDFLSPPPEHPLSPPPGETPNPCVEADPMAGGNMRRFQPSEFPFVTTVADDGTDKGGGWQEAKAKLIIYPTATGGAVCGYRIGMPLRSRAWGRVPNPIAAIYTAKVANAAADVLYDNGSFNLPPGIICSKFRTELEKQFPEMFKGMGVTVAQFFP